MALRYASEELRSDPSFRLAVAEVIKEAHPRSRKIDRDVWCSSQLESRRRGVAATSVAAQMAVDEEEEPKKHKWHKNLLLRSFTDAIRESELLRREHAALAAIH